MEGIAMKIIIRWVVVWLLLVGAAQAIAQDDVDAEAVATEAIAEESVDGVDQIPQKHLLLIVGAPGQTEYETMFQQWADRWEALVTNPAGQVDPADPADSPNESPASPRRDTGIGLTRIGIPDAATEINDLQKIETALGSVSDAVDELWIVLIGHGTYDQKTAKFNLRGPDLTSVQLDQWLDRLDCQVIVINCSSASGPFINDLAGPGRVVVTATKSGFQYNFARLGKHLSECIADPSIDLDKDQQTSLLEAFLAASARTQEFYEMESRLATELALIDDNGDGLGTPSDWFRGVRAVEKPKQGEIDGLLANQIVLVRRGIEATLTAAQIERRNEIENQIENLRQRKSRLAEDEYYRLLEPLMIDLAKLYEQAETGD